ncbi:HTH-type transcriptional regulator [Pasteurella multocida]|uniref:Transcriptional regulator, TetR family n=1 Tax=Pasteurella dagmatis ATCC 43325 TaxID=667128 RepID=C9PNR0_9PAST|nr:HTH-type transcriptional repressor FabR [Pasteurella dagmatis]EEX50701.1 transcriptional regulator, TetR family [Pasteurella dagmatis ATCC 43325]SNV74911.1 HTH-type transcriptional regulator [Pasteurella dagmatis]VEI58458.1 HTH-type transcriptional regulator [Pasteurella multocida]
MAGIRALQKEKTRRALIDAAFNQLTAEQSFSNLSLREVAREAGIAATSFYRHFKDMDELGLTMVDEAGLVLRQLMRQARKRLEKGGSVIAISVDTFFEFIANNPNMFRLLLRESSGTSQAFRTAAAREIKHFVDELTEYIAHKNGYPQYIAYVQAEGMVTIVFTAGANALDMGKTEREQLKARVILQLRMLAKGVDYTADKDKYGK